MGGVGEYMFLEGKVRQSRRFHAHYGSVTLHDSFTVRGRFSKDGKNASGQLQYTYENSGQQCATEILDWTVKR